MNHQGSLWLDEASEAKPRGGALFSDDGLYRYELTREWGPGKLVCFIGLNPSTADAEQDDPTIRRCISFAKREGGGRLLMLNLFSWRSTNPKALIGLPNPIGEPPEEIAPRWNNAALVIAAWGAIHKSLRWRAGQVADMLCGDSRARCLGTTADGSPRHPLYVRGTAPLQAWPALNDHGSDK
jgi:hypothetical protein